MGKVNDLMKSWVSTEDTDKHRASSKSKSKPKKNVFSAPDLQTKLQKRNKQMKKMLDEI